MTARSVDADEIARFSELATNWWDPQGPMRPLHRLNPPRLLYLRRRLEELFGLDGRTLRPFVGLRLLDVGCGAGLLSEPMARLGAQVTAIDASPEMIDQLKKVAATLEADWIKRASGKGYDPAAALKELRETAKSLDKN